MTNSLSILASKNSATGPSQGSQLGNCVLQGKDAVGVREFWIPATVPLMLCVRTARLAK